MVLNIFRFILFVMGVQCAVAYALPYEMQADDRVLPRTDIEINAYMYEMFRTFDQIAKEHDIQYWATAGTLLGYVRHGGMVPWDDDIDVEISPGAEKN